MSNGMEYYSNDISSSNPSNNKDGNFTNRYSNSNEEFYDSKIKKAYEVMGIREGASREEIERRYYLLAKKHLILKRENVKCEVAGLNMEKINEAYYLLIGLRNQDAEQVNEYDGKPQKLVPYVWENYKKAVLVTVVILISSLFFFFSDAKDDSISIVFFGEFENIYDQIQLLKEKNVEKRMSGRENIIIQQFMLSDEMPMPYKIEMLMAAYNFVTQGDYHILIMDKESFEEYGPVANIVRLDSLVQELEIDSSSCFAIKKQYTDEKEHIYGLDGSHLFSGKDLIKDEPSHIIVIKDGLNKDTVKSITEIIHLLMN